MRKSEVVKRQKEELDRFREVFAIAMEGGDTETVKDLKLKLEIMHKRHEMERKAWGIGDAAKGAEKKRSGKSSSRAISPEVREKLNEIYGSC